jgi:ATP-dependent Clp protease ATP-binding subunit ClpA
MFNDEDALIRIDMSEYSEKHTVSRLIGAAPGYVGYDEGGQLTEAVRRKPYSVILFDEIEKAHPEIFNIMLQIFDDGRLTDSKGKTVDFKNTLIILTSNIGSDIILENTVKSMLSEKEYDNLKEEIESIMKAHFKPEFLNRIDETVFFKALSMQDLSKITDIQIKYLENLLKEQEITMKITDEAKDFIAREGFNPQYGARPLKRTIMQLVENPLAKIILKGEIKNGDTAVIDTDDEKIIIKKE